LCDLVALLRRRSDLGERVGLCNEKHCTDQSCYCTSDCCVIHDRTLILAFCHYPARLSFPVAFGQPGQAALKLDHALLPLAMLGHAGEIVPLQTAPSFPFISIVGVAIL
jgi:hypothetical protein